MHRCYYSSSIASFIAESDLEILGKLTKCHPFALEEQQRNAWMKQIEHLKVWLAGSNGHLLFEYSIPRMGKRVDCVLISKGVIFPVEFKVGAEHYAEHAIDQVMDYALDLKNFHAGCHDRKLVPVLVCTNASDREVRVAFGEDGVSEVILSNGGSLGRIISEVAGAVSAPAIDADAWLSAPYKPTPTIIEAAQALYQGHSVGEISRSDASGKNLTRTSTAISRIIECSRRNHEKAICFLTGVPGAGKTLAGLNLANSHQHIDSANHAVFLSGNGPLVEVLQEALARNAVEEGKSRGEKRRKGVVLSRTKAFIQNIHHFRDDAIADENPPHERVVIFDEAQRAWTQKQTAAFMKAKKGRDHFAQSEPEFLISVMDRHTDWAAIICLIGGGQEINTGEAGLHEWFDSLARSFPQWKIYVSSQLTDSEYTQGRELFAGLRSAQIHFEDDLHLAVSVRSFRSEKVAAFVKAVLDCDTEKARRVYREIGAAYPIVLTRDLATAKKWLRSKARGSERAGLLASSGALRLKPVGIHVKAEIDPRYWFLNSKEDIRSSHFLEDVATEFDVQGLEIDWACVAWDANFRFVNGEWAPKQMIGTKWNEVNDLSARVYLKNAYRVLLTRARQGMVIFVPHGDRNDKTRLPEFYDSTYGYLRSLGIGEFGG